MDYNRCLKLAFERIAIIEEKLDTIIGILEPQKQDPLQLVGESTDSDNAYIEGIFNDLSSRGKVTVTPNPKVEEPKGYKIQTRATSPNAGDVVKFCREADYNGGNIV